jgi:hypothetical protein
MQMGNPKSGGRGMPAFCVLEYLPKFESSYLPVMDRVVLLAEREGGRPLRILVHPKLLQVIQETDRPYIGSLLEDMLERGKVDAERLFQQLSSLTAGPLVTRAVGERIADHTEIAVLAAQFVPLEQHLNR